jgi:hypothetical protein
VNKKIAHSTKEENLMETMMDPSIQISKKRKGTFGIQSDFFFLEWARNLQKNKFLN